MALASPQKVLVAWDLDNIRPTVDQIKAFHCAAQLDLVRKKTDVLLAANSWTLEKIFPVQKEACMKDLVHWGHVRGLRIEIIETERRRQAVDRVIAQRIVDFVDQDPDASPSALYVVSNDSDFAPIMAYALSRRPSITAITVGTCRPSRNSNAKTKKPNIRLSEVANRTLKIEWGAHGEDICIVTELQC